MQDEELTLYNTCTDLVSLKKWEAFPLYLFGSKRAGEWIAVHEFCRQIGIAVADTRPELFASWLADPLGNPAYGVVLFFDNESKWSMAAHYNRARLQAETSQVQALQANGTAPIATSSASTQESGRPSRL